jgi:hypothetical protein
LLKQELATRSITLPEISEEVTKNDFIRMAADELGMSNNELMQFLWNNYQPSKIWVVYSGIALSAVVLLWLYDRFILEK